MLRNTKTYGWSTHETPLIHNFQRRNLSISLKSKILFWVYGTKRINSWQWFRTYIAICKPLITIKWNSSLQMVRLQRCLCAFIRNSCQRVVSISQPYLPFSTPKHDNGRCRILKDCREPVNVTFSWDCTKMMKNSKP